MGRCRVGDSYRPLVGGRTSTGIGLRLTHPSIDSPFRMTHPSELLKLA